MTDHQIHATQCGCLNDSSRCCRVSCLCHAEAEPYVVGYVGIPTVDGRVISEVPILPTLVPVLDSDHQHLGHAWIGLAGDRLIGEFSLDGLRRLDAGAHPEIGLKNTVVDHLGPSEPYSARMRGEIGYVLLAADRPDYRPVWDLPDFGHPYNPRSTP